MSDLEQRVAELERLVAELRKPSEPKERRTRAYTGSPPDLEEYRHVGTVEFYGARWDVYVEKASAASWRQARVVAAPGYAAPHKANYVLYWNTSTNTFGNSGGWEALNEHRPDLRAAVEQLLKGQDQ